MPNTLNVQARPRRDGTTGLSRAQIDPSPLPYSVPLTWTTDPEQRCSTFPTLAGAFSAADWLSMERWGRSRPTQEIRWPEGKKEVKHRRTERCFLRPERHPIILWRHQAKGRQRQTESYVTPLLLKDKFYRFLLSGRWKLCKNRLYVNVTVPLLVFLCSPSAACLESEPDYIGGGWNAELRTATKQPPKLRTVHGRVHETSDKDAHAVSG